MAVEICEHIGICKAGRERYKLQGNSSYEVAINKKDSSVVKG